MHPSRPHHARFLSALVLIAFMKLPCVCLAAPVKDASPHGGGNGNPGVLPLGTSAFGHTYGEWAERYWQWVFAQPTPTNPQLDATGEFAGVGQSGPLWFLAGTFGSSVERTLTVPAGKGLFFAVQPWIFGAGTFDCEPTVPGVPCDLSTLHAAAATAADGSSVVEASIDGVPVSDAIGYRAADDGSFSITVPADNPIGIPAGTYSPQVVDGYWLLLAPLSLGSHTLQCHVVSNQFGGLDFTILDHIQVVASQGMTAQTTTTEFWKSAGADVAPAPVVRRSTWGHVKASYR